MILVISFVPSGKGKEISRKILEKRLALNISIKSVSTIKIEEENIKEEEQDLLIISTRKELFDILKDFMKSMNICKVPEIIEIKVDDVNKEYLDILELETSIKKVKNA
ncbi:divalent-cation tolerance protein CutA [Nanobdella aerobiophila]|uniref:Divalent-cation tolerance protein CutA n=1 Tax=Nanobdella aerobiophila TaxID=2586965 RepID=A0A915SKG6_9ARCH|nr:divalent cation tolerance protein CutA [Nanobdella aerobiophila]BBL45316.1 divalent-cation tolerance protein CutA [Nanobdella aerobiophila]